MRKMTLDELEVMTTMVHTNELLILPILIKNKDLDLDKLKALTKFCFDNIPLKLEDKTSVELNDIRKHVLEARHCLLLIYAKLEEERYDLEIILPDIQKKIMEGEDEKVKP